MNFKPLLLLATLSSLNLALLLTAPAPPPCQHCSHVIPIATPLAMTTEDSTPAPIRRDPPRRAKFDPPQPRPIVHRHGTAAELNAAIQGFWQRRGFAGDPVSKSWQEAAEKPKR